MVNSIAELDRAIRNELDFTDEDMNQYILFEEHDTYFAVKYKRWLPPSMGGLKLKDFLVEKLGAKYEKYPKAKFIIERREAEAPNSSTAPKEQLDELAKEPQPAKIVTVKLNQLQYGVFSPRKTNKKWIEHLKEAIQNEGVESFPLPKTRPHPNGRMADERFQLVDGEHFCKSLEELGVKTVKIEVRNLTDEEADYEAMRSNQTHGKPLEPIEKARHLKKMMEKYSLNQKQIAEKFKRSPAWVSNHLSLLKLDNEEFTRVNSLTSTHAREIVTAPEDARQEIVDKIEREELSTRPTSELVQDIKETPEKTHEVLAAPYDPLGVECSLCGMGTHFPLAREGKKVCSSCADKIDKDPNLIKNLKEKPSPPKKTTETKEYKPKDTWAYRKSLMSVPESKADVDVLTELQRRGHKIKWQPTVVLVWTTPEYFVDEKAYFYNDGEAVHEGKGERDDELREMLADKTGKLVYGIPYKVHSKKNVKMIADFIEEKVGKNQ